MLIIKNLCKSFENRIILKNINLQAKRGCATVLVGSSGVGKSTLLRILCNLEQYDNGTMTLDNQVIDSKTIHTNHIVGMVFQQFNLFSHFSVEKNITFALEKVTKKSSKEAHKIAEALLKKYNLSEKAKLPITQLSGGQKQRLAIARTIALQPKIVCLDEPTSALDPLLTTYVVNSIQTLAQEGFIILIASHDTMLLEKLECNIHLMKDGSIIESAYSHSFWKEPNTFPEINKFIKGTI